MIKLLFKGIRIENKIRFFIFTSLYVLTLLLYIFLSSIEGVFDASLHDFTGIFLLLPNLPNAFYHGPFIAVIFVLASFFEILFIAWQTNLENQRLNRFILFFMLINLFFAVIGFSITGGLFSFGIAIFVFVFLITIPTIIVIKVMEKKGISEYSDILTEEEIEELKKK